MIDRQTERNSENEHELGTALIYEKLLAGR